MSYWGFRSYVPVAQRRANAAKEVAKLKKQGRAVSPVVTEGRKIAKSFWGKAWCDNLERYSDFANRLPRGRTYVNNGSVVDLQLARGKVEALVSGSELYRIRIEIAVATSARWKAICADCAGSVGSIVELLQGKLSKHVMERVCRDADGLFPAPNEIKMSCSCPDRADMCKHVAAALYGVGARLDHDPDLLFTLRGVDRGELVSTGADLSITEAAVGSERVLADGDVAALFGLELEIAVPATATAKKKEPADEHAIVTAQQAPPRAARGRATKAEHKLRTKRNCAEEPNDGVSTRTPGPRRVKSVSEAASSVGVEGGPPTVSRNIGRTLSISSKANRTSGRNGAKPEPASQRRRGPKRKPKVNEKLTETLTPAMAPAQERVGRRGAARHNRVHDAAIRGERHPARPEPQPVVGLD